MSPETVRHVLATLAYRSRQVLAVVPDGFPDFEAGSGVRTPIEILRHMSSVLTYAGNCFHRREWQPLEPLSWEGEKQRFEKALRRLDGHLASGVEPEKGSFEVFLQGPICDALTHVGQLATLRRLAGMPVPGENFMKAPIEIGRLEI